MFEKLIDLLVTGWAHVAPFVVVDPYEGAGVLRLGKYHRTLGNGFHWKWPLLEKAIEVTTCVTTLRLPPQSLTTKDGQQAVISCIIKYEIKNIKPYICDIYDQKDALADSTMGAIGRLVRSKTLAELMSMSLQLDREVVNEVRDEVNPYGFKVHRVTFVDLSTAKSFRLLQSSVTKDIDN